MATDPSVCNFAKLYIVTLYCNNSLLLIAPAVGLIYCEFAERVWFCGRSHVFGNDVLQTDLNSMLVSLLSGPVSTDQDF